MPSRWHSLRCRRPAARCQTAASGEDATISPGWERVRESARSAARDPWVWAPLAGAAILQIDGWDEQITDWAVRETPVFGSVQNASDWSDYLETFAQWSWVASALATPGGREAGPWFEAKAKGFAVDLVAIHSAIGTTQFLKSETNRVRPDGSDDKSFPSGHVTNAAVYGGLASLNLKWIPMNPNARTALVVGLDAVTLATVWARVEAAAHYPADGLVGLAIGSFFSSFFNDAFLGLDDDSEAGIALAPAADGVTLSFSFQY
jgi:membrane-associated phospholipid phosphatase